MHRRRVHKARVSLRDQSSHVWLQPQESRGNFTDDSTKKKNTVTKIKQDETFTGCTRGRGVRKRHRVATPPTEKGNAPTQGREKREKEPEESV